MTLRAWIVGTTACWLLAGCAPHAPASTSATPYRGAVMPGREAVTTSIDRDMDGRSSRISIRNNGDVPLRITEIELYDCVNVNQPCLPMDPRLTVGPGQQLTVMTVGAADPQFGYSFRVRFHTDAVRAARAPEPIETWTEAERNGDGFRILFRNNTSAPVRITSIELFECENINQDCAATAVDLKLAPGQSGIAMTVRPRLAGYESRFRYRFLTARGS